jgi:hypothetical protein
MRRNDVTDQSNLMFEAGLEATSQTCSGSGTSSTRLTISSRLLVRDPDLRATVGVTVRRNCLFAILTCGQRSGVYSAEELREAASKLRLRTGAVGLHKSYWTVNPVRIPSW